MPRDYKVYLDDIGTACRKIRLFVRGYSYSKFVSDEKTVDAVIRNLEIIGEAAGKMPLEVRRKHPAVEWKKISGLRNILVHEYFGVNLEIIWDVVQNKLPLLSRQIQKITKSS